MIQSATRTDRAKCPRRPSKSHQIGGFHSTTPKKCGIHARCCHALETHMYITRGLWHNDTLTLSDSAQTYVSFTKKRGSISDPLYLVAIFNDELCQLLLSLHSLRLRNQRHQIRKSNQHKYADYHQHDQHFRKGEGPEALSLITLFVYHVV